MNTVELVLNKTRKTIREACIEAGIEFEEDLVPNLETCTSCMTWYKHSIFKKDLDGNLICTQCYNWYGV
jgi:hypothetical protein